MNNKTWSCEPIQTRSSLNELNEIKKDSYKAYMVTYQTGDWIKAGVNLGRVSSSGGEMGRSPHYSKNWLDPLYAPVPHLTDLLRKCLFCNFHAVFGHFAQNVLNYRVWTPALLPDWSNCVFIACIKQIKVSILYFFES